MKRALIILFLGIAVAVLAYCSLYFGTTVPHRAMLHGDMPELEWLKKEFQLDDAEFKHIAALHESYMPRCDEMCRRIEAQHAELKASILQNNTVTAEIEQQLADAARLRAECQRMMLEHFYQVSRAMPPEQGQRYLAWVQEQTLLCENATNHRRK